MENATLHKSMTAAVLFLAVAGFLLGYFSRPLHDYIFYIDDWNNILFGTKRALDAWHIPIAYGPLYYVLALFYNIHPKMPHLLAIACWVLSSRYILKLFLKRNDKKLLIAVWLLLFLNPLLWFYIIYYGSIDAFLSFLMLFGLVFYSKKKYSRSALCLTLGILLKLIPIFIVPFLIFKKRKINYDFLLPFSLIFTLGSGIAYWCFDINFIANFLFQANRESATLSVFRFLRGDNSPLRLFTDHPNVDFLSPYLIIISLSVLFFIHIKYKFNTLISCVLSLLLLFTFHIVGNHQYYISLLFLMLFLIYKIPKLDIRNERKTTIVSLSFLAFVSSIPLIELLIRRVVPSFGSYYDNSIGLFVFIISIVVIYTLFESQFKQKATQPN